MIQKYITISYELSVILIENNGYEMLNRAMFSDLNKNNDKTRMHSSRMRTDRAVMRMSSDRVAMRPIVDRMTDACENITFPCGR